MIRSLEEDRARHDAWMARQHPEVVALPVDPPPLVLIAGQAKRLKYRARKRAWYWAHKPEVLAKLAAKRAAARRIVGSQA